MEEMVDKWHTLGFVVQQGNTFVEVDRCDTTFITLLTLSLNFQDVPQGPVGLSRKTALAVSFEVKSTGSAVTLEVQPGDLPTHPRLTLPRGATLHLRGVLAHLHTRRRRATLHPGRSGAAVGGIWSDGMRGG
jgi:hypothetical protein